MSRCRSWFTYKRIAYEKREISRVFTNRTPERPSEIGTSRSHISNDPIIPMEMDEMEISYDLEDEQYDSGDK